MEYLSNRNHIVYRNFTHDIANNSGGGGSSNGVNGGNSGSSGGTSNVVKSFAELGARSIDNAGPLQDLKSILYKHMQPWRNGE